MLAKVTILILDRTNFNARKFIKGKEGHVIMIWDKFFKKTYQSLLCMHHKRENQNA